MRTVTKMMEFHVTVSRNSRIMTKTIFCPL